MAGPSPEDRYNPVPTVSPTGAPSDYLSVRANPNAFGAQIGQGMESLGSNLKEVSNQETSYILQKQGLANEHEANAAELQLTVDNGNTYNKFKGLSGLAASNAKDSYVQQILDNNARIRAGISNQAAQKAYDLLATRRIGFTITDMNSYAADQRRSAYRQGNLDSMAVSIDRATSYDVANSDTQFNDEIANIVHQANTNYTAPDYGKYDGYEVSVNKDGTLKFKDSNAQADYDNFLNKYTGAAWENRILTLANDISHPDPLKAADVLLANRDNMPSVTYRKLSAQLKGPVTSERVRQTVDNYIDSAHESYVSTQGPSGDLDMDQIQDAFNVQESGRGQSSKNVGQIQPDTWKKFAKPGENINDAKDNLAVQKRYIEYLQAKPFIGKDLSRLATAYFSGEGNVSDSGPTPWKVDRQDASGKRVSEYVSDMTKRFGGNLRSGAPSNTYQSELDYLGDHEGELVEGVRQSMADQGYDVTVQDQAAARMEARIAEKRSIQLNEQRSLTNRLLDTVTNPENPITNMGNLDYNPDPQIRQAWTRLRFLNPYAEQTMQNLINSQAAGQAKTYGTNFYPHLMSVLNGGVTDPTQLGDFLGGDKSEISNSGFKNLNAVIKLVNDPKNAGMKAAMMNYFKNAKTSITGNFNNPVVNKAFDQFTQAALPQVLAQIKAGKSLPEIFGKDSDLQKTIETYQISTSQLAAAMAPHVNLGTFGQTGVHLDDITDPKKGIAELKRRLEAGQDIQAIKQYALKRGWIRATPPSVPLPQ